MPLTLKAINQLEMLGAPIAAEIESSSSDLRCWVAVYPLSQWKPVDYVVRKFELKKELLDSEFDIHQEDLVNPDDRAVTGIQEVEAVLEEWQVSAEKLAAPWHCDYPM